MKTNYYFADLFDITKLILNDSELNKLITLTDSEDNIIKRSVSSSLYYDILSVKDFIRNLKSCIKSVKHFTNTERIYQIYYYSNPSYIRTFKRLKLRLKDYYINSSEFEWNFDNNLFLALDTLIYFTEYSSTYPAGN